MKVLVIDPRNSGIAGDMFLASLIDLTGDLSVLSDLENEINRLENCRKFRVEVREDNVGIRAKILDITIDERRLKNPEELKKAVNTVSKNIDVSNRALKIVDSIIGDLIEVEGRLHGRDFHLHEIASLDTIFDVVGSVIILDRQGFLDGDIYATPPVLGSGFVNVEHGRVAVPAPATLEILRKHRLRFLNFSVEAELTTPTGAAILANVTNSIVDFVPPMTPLRIGYGAGTRRFSNLMNVLRIIEGEDFKAVNDRIVMIETNVDDVSGEVVGHVVNKLLAEGAVDVFVTQAIGKKNRPVNVISVIANHKNYERLVELLMEETGTIGVRIYETPRLVAERVKEKIEVEVGGKKYLVTVKKSTLGERTINLKPEYEDLRRISEDARVPLRVVWREVNKVLTCHECD